VLRKWLPSTKQAAQRRVVFLLHLAATEVTGKSRIAVFHTIAPEKIDRFRQAAAVIFDFFCALRG
jgi:hypothetical protein